MADQPHTKRRFRFSLRTLLIVVTLGSAGFGWLSYKLRQAQQQSAAIELILAAGGEVFYDDEVDSEDEPLPSPPGPVQQRPSVAIDLFSDVARVDFWFVRDSDSIDWFNNDHHSERFRVVFLMGEKYCASPWYPPRGYRRDRIQITDGDLALVQCLTRLKYLDLAETQITDEGLIRLQGLSELKALSLSNTRVTDAGLIHLRGIKNLRCLSLLGTSITDAALSLLQGHATLECLDLEETLVTDAGLVHLRGLTHLTNLNVKKTKITVAGCEELHEHLPNATICVYK